MPPGRQKKELTNKMRGVHHAPHLPDSHADLFLGIAEHHAAIVTHGAPLRHQFYFSLFFPMAVYHKLRLHGIPRGAPRSNLPCLGTLCAFCGGAHGSYVIFLFNKNCSTQFQRFGCA